MQSRLPDPLHVSHEEWQLVHEATVPDRSTNVPELGHSATHVPLWRKGVLADVQLRQLELDAPLQVPQAASHAWQTWLPSAYLPTGVHEARHEPPSKKGCEDAQVRQADAPAPEQVAHDASHATHVSAEEALPPEQKNPPSTWQFWLQPSRLS